MLPAHIYGLVDPRTGQIRYVGKTIQPLALRLSQHTVHSGRHPTIGPKHRWIAELKSLGLKPEIKLLETVMSHGWQLAEREWGRRLAKSCKLLNVPGKLGLGSTRTYVVNWTPELDARLGKEVDAVIAHDLGVTRKAVTYRRKVVGVAACNDKGRMKPPPPMGGHNRKALSEGILSKLGTMPDYQLAIVAGVNKKLIRGRRIALGIPSHAEKTGNRGTFKTGNFPARWLKHRTLKKSA